MAKLDFFRHFVREFLATEVGDRGGVGGHGDGGVVLEAVVFLQDAEGELFEFRGFVLDDAAVPTPVFVCFLCVWNEEMNDLM